MRLFFFFFSSRRRHTRLQGDWSSDVCSSDLAVRQPGGTPVAEAARKVALKFPHEMSPVAELFLFLAARADLVQRVIRPALEAGQVVVGDRFDLSTIAYQVAGGGLPAEDVAYAIRLATGGLVPDVTLVLDVPVEVGRA